MSHEIICYLKFYSTLIDWFKSFYLSGQRRIEHTNTSELSYFFALDRLGVNNNWHDI